MPGRSAVAKPDVCYIYLMGLEGGGPSKIGYAVVPAKRLKQLQALQEGKMIILGEWPAVGRLAFKIERYVHWQFRDRHFRGEWFHVSLSEVEAAVERAKAAPLEDCGLIPPLDAPGREIRFAEHMAMRFEAGTMEAIDGCREGGEDRTDFVRLAVQELIARRLRTPRKPLTPTPD
jgi:hypothetical protein